ncbi:MAG: hypothetical protein ACM3TR_14745 [Caulobacteraceae bacterium]
MALKKNTGIGYLEQEPESVPGNTVYNALLEGMGEIAALKNEMLCPLKRKNQP